MKYREYSIILSAALYFNMKCIYMERVFFTLNILGIIEDYPTMTGNVTVFSVKTSVVVVVPRVVKKIYKNSGLYTRYKHRIAQRRV